MDQIDPKEVKRREDLNEMALVLLRQARVDLDSATPIDRAVVSFFVFGMILAHAKADSLEEPAIFALGLLVFMDSLGQSLSDATSNVQDSIWAASDPASHRTGNAVISDGIDGYKQYMGGDIVGLTENINSILETCRNAAKK